MSFLKCVEPAYNSKINTLKSKYSIQAACAFPFLQQNK